MCGCSVHKAGSDQISTAHSIMPWWCAIQGVQYMGKCCSPYLLEYSTGRLWRSDGAFNEIVLVFQENEYVVEGALKEFHSSFQLQHILPQWEQRGLPVFEGGMFNKTHSYSQVLYLLIAECVSAKLWIRIYCHDVHMLRSCSNVQAAHSSTDSQDWKSCAVLEANKTRAASQKNP